MDKSKAVLYFANTALSLLALLSFMCVQTLQYLRSSVLFVIRIYLRMASDLIGYMEKCLYVILNVCH